MLRAFHYWMSLLLLGFIAGATQAQNSWVGKTILLKKPPIKADQAGEQGKQDYDAVLSTIAYRVLDNENGRIKVKTARGSEHWLDKDNVVPLADAVNYFTERLREDSVNADYYCCRGSAWQQLGDLEKAIGDFTTAIRLDPRAHAFHNRGSAYLAKGDFDKGIADCSEAIRLDRTLAVAFVSRGAGWLHKQEYDKAIADCNEAIRLDRKLAPAYLNRGNAAHARKEYELAIADYGEAIRLDPKDAGMLYNRAMVWVDKSELKKALTDYTEAIQIDPAFLGAWQGRADVWYEMKEYEKAIADYDQAVRIAPHNQFAYARRAFLWATCPEAKHRNGKQAIDSAKKALAIAKGDAGVMECLAAAYAELGEFDQAVRWQETALKDPQWRDDPAAQRRRELYRIKMPYRTD